MADIEEKTMRKWSDIILPRVLSAAAWGLIWSLLLLVPYDRIITGINIPDVLPVEESAISYFLFAFIGIEIAIQLVKGTIIQYALGMTRGFVTIFFLVLITNGGILGFSTTSTPEMPLPTGLTVTYIIDFRILLGGFLLFSLLGIVRNLLQAVDFLSEKAEEPNTLHELP